MTHRLRNQDFLQTSDCRRQQSPFLRPVCIICLRVCFGECKHNRLGNTLHSAQLALETRNVDTQFEIHSLLVLLLLLLPRSTIHPARSGEESPWHTSGMCACPLLQVLVPRRSAFLMSDDLRLRPLLPGVARSPAAVTCMRRVVHSHRRPIFTRSCSAERCALMTGHLRAP